VLGVIVRVAAGCLSLFLFLFPAAESGHHVDAAAAAAVAGGAGRYREDRQVDRRTPREHERGMGVALVE
jgi:hypothetical protein